MSERKGPPSSSSDDRRKFNDSWRYGNRYGSGNGPSASSTNGSSNNEYPSSGRRFGGSDARSGSYSKSRPSNYGRYSSYQSGYGNYNKRYNGPYRSNSSSNVGTNTSAVATNNNNVSSSSGSNPSNNGASQDPHSYHSKSSAPQSTSTSTVPTSTTTQPPFQRYRSLQDVSSSTGTINDGSKKRNNYSGLSYDSRADSYRSGGRYYGSSGYRDRDRERDASGYGYRGYQQRKSSNEYLAKKERPPQSTADGRQDEDDDLIYGSIKPKSSEPPQKAQARNNSDTSVAAGESSVADEDKAQVKDEDDISKRDEELAADEHHEKVELKAEADEQKQLPAETAAQEAPKAEANTEPEPRQQAIEEDPQVELGIAEAEEEKPQVEISHDSPADKMDVDEEPEAAKSQTDEPVTRESSVSSDSYNPSEAPVTETIVVSKEIPVEAKFEVVVTSRPKASMISSLRDDTDEMDLDAEDESIRNALQNQKELEAKQTKVLGDELELKENYLPKDIEGYIFPMNRLETKLWNLKTNTKLNVRSRLPYLNSKPLVKLTRYPFYESNLLIHQQAIKPELDSKLQILKKYVELKGKKLALEFYEKDERYQARVKIMEDQLKEFHPELNAGADKDANAKLQESKSSQDLAVVADHPTSTRRNRNTGIVNSEAEFAEILQRMKEEEESDPLFRARQAAAVIPEMIIDPIARDAFKFFSTNNLVTDLEEWTSRLKTDKIDNFTKEEHEMFCEAYASYPKRFGKISATMSFKRSSQDCVLHYYRTKRTTNYKALVAAKNKRSGRKSGSSKGRAKASGKSKTGTAVNNTPTVATPVATKGEDQDYFAQAADSQSESKSPSEPKAGVVLAESVTEPIQQQEPSTEELEAKKRTLTDENLDSIDQKLALAADEPKTKKQRVSTKKSAKDAENVKTEDVLHEVNPAPVEEVEVDSELTNVAHVVEAQQDSTPTDISHTAAAANADSAQYGGPDAAGAAKSSKKDKKPPHITSYWSINDANKFPAILAEFGTQWAAIAKEIQTKTTTMVRNYYSKNANSENNWVAIAREADIRRNRNSGTAVTSGDADNQQAQPLAAVAAQSFQGPMESVPQQPQQPPLPPHFKSEDHPHHPMKLPSLKDITHGMSEVYREAPPATNRYLSPSPPPTFGSVSSGNSNTFRSLISPPVQQRPKIEERSYPNILSGPPSAPISSVVAPVIPAAPKQTAAPSRTSIMSLLNSEPESTASTTPKPIHASPLNNILNPTSSTKPAPSSLSQVQPLPQAPPVPQSRGLFSLAALAEVATEGYNNANNNNTNNAQGSNSTSNSDSYDARR